MDLVLGPKVRPIPALGNAQGRLEEIIFYNPSRLHSRTKGPGVAAGGMVK